MGRPPAEPHPPLPLTTAHPAPLPLAHPAQGPTPPTPAPTAGRPALLPPPPAPPPPAAPPEPPDLDALADLVLHRIERRALAQRERLGRG
ncbi:hypothetical protein ACFYVL_04225 [Streptomyces sp. NPDC004111]|uniref:hypothetical protein n=1 Tax=Streptomyces sp. NPDC004111 TaxID=3364690 RepID=UPI003690D340